MVRRKKQTNPHKHVDWREGRPRFNPGTVLRAAGYKARDLKHQNGSWFTKGEAVDWSLALCERLERERSIKRSKSPVASSSAKRPHREAPKLYTIEKMFDDWFKSQRFKEDSERPLAKTTNESYRVRANVLQQHDIDLYGSAVEALSRSIVRGIFDSLWKERGLASAQATVRALSSAISWAILHGKVNMQINPCFSLRMETPRPRVRFASRQEIEALVAMADYLDRQEIGDMVLLGVWTG